MDFIQQLHIWVKGETAQGKVIITIGVLLFLAIIFIAKSENTLLKGMIIPISLLLIMNIGYGYVLIKRPQTSKKTEANYQQNPQQTITKEYAKSIKGANGYYAPFTKVWAAMVIITLLLYFVFKNEYIKGISLGLTIMFLGMFLIDTFLHNRVKLYINSLQELISQQ